MLALYQSGLSVNRLSFTSLLPYEDFESIYNDTIQRLESLSNLETFANLNVFERNNWGNDDVVPYEKARWINLKRWYTSVQSSNEVSSKEYYKFC